MATSRLMDKLNQVVLTPDGSALFRDLTHVYAKDGTQVGKTYLRSLNDKVQVRNVNGYIWEVIGTL